MDVHRDYPLLAANFVNRTGLPSKKRIVAQGSTRFTARTLPETHK